MAINASRHTFTPQGALEEATRHALGNTELPSNGTKVVPRYLLVYLPGDNKTRADVGLLCESLFLVAHSAPPLF